MCTSLWLLLTTLGLPAARAAAPAARVLTDGTTLMACVVDGARVERDRCPSTALEIGWVEINDGPLLTTQATVTLAASMTKEECGIPCEVDLSPKVTARTDPRPLGLGAQQITVMRPSSARYQELIGQALGRSNPQITQLVRIDLQGDGVEEVLFVLSTPSTNPGAAQDPAEADSEVGIRWLSGGGVETDLLADGMGDFQRRIAGFTDLDGDGVLEVLIGYSALGAVGLGVGTIQDGSYEQLGFTGSGN